MSPCRPCYNTRLEQVPTLQNQRARRLLMNIVQPLYANTKHSTAWHGATCSQHNTIPATAVSLAGPIRVPREQAIAVTLTVPPFPSLIMLCSQSVPRAKQHQMAPPPPPLPIAGSLSILSADKPPRQQRSRTPHGRPRCHHIRPRLASTHGVLQTSTHAARSTTQCQHPHPVINQLS